MEEILSKIWGLLGIPAVWGSILTLITVGMGVLFKRLIDHELEVQLKKIEALQTQDVFVRELYAEGIKEYSREQTQALRQAYLILFQPHSSTVSTAGLGFEEQLDTAIQVVMEPLRNHVGLLDESTIRKINSVQNYLLNFKGRTPEELKKEKSNFYNETEVARQFVKVDKIAFRCGLISRPLEERDQK